MGDYTEEEFQRDFVDERTLDEEYEVDSRRVAHVEECSGVDGEDDDDGDGVYIVMRAAMLFVSMA